LEAKLETQRAQLSRQLRNLYTQLPTSTIKILLHPTDAQDVKRLGHYGVKLKEAHQAKITSIADDQRSLDSINKQLNDEVAALKQARVQALQQQEQLAKHRVDRQQTLKQLAATQRSKESRIAAINEEVKALQALIAKLKPMTRQVQVKFSQRKGKLEPAVKGKIVSHYGSTREGHLKWQGQRIAARAASAVKAVADGQVVFAGWLKGQGMIALIDHGEHYLSLYSNTEMLYVEEGQWVSSGDTIARLSESTEDATLYFELSRNGRPINPRYWYR